MDKKMVEYAGYRCFDKILKGFKDTWGWQLCLNKNMNNVAWIKVLSH